MFKVKAFSLLELLVVMGILAMMAGLGIYGLTRFQANTKVQTVFNDTVSLLKTMQNNARNSVSFVDNSSLDPSICVSNGNCTADYFGIRFQSNNYSVYGCLDSGSNVICDSNNEIALEGTDIAGVTFTYTGTACNYIVFERLSGDIKDIQPNPLWTPSSNTVCNLRISNSYGDNRTIIINLTNNSITNATV